MTQTLTTLAPWQAMSHHWRYRNAVAVSSYVHRLDKGGQFISYRQMEQWKNAVACQLQKCTTKQQLQHLWNAIEYDHTKHNQQYADSVLPFLKKIWAKCKETISKLSEIFTTADTSSAPKRAISTG